jgi:hypothetical protein
VLIFLSWADEIWKQSQDSYALIALRNTVVLYPSCDERFSRIKVLRLGEVIGWTVALTTTMKEHKHFGDMQVGSVVDCLALPGEEQSVIGTITRYLEGLEVDIIVTISCISRGAVPLQRRVICSVHQISSLRYPRRLQTNCIRHLRASQVHMTRGDGDGPIHL